ncbi:MAG: hypothetical protein WBX38_14045, partial [Candidatus Sulfotelmatobacter sp.]
LTLEPLYHISKVKGTFLDNYIFKRIIGLIKKEGVWGLDRVLESVRIIPLRGLVVYSLLSSDEGRG